MSHEEDTNMLCYRWIVEYDCWRMWTKFSELGSVDGIPNHSGLTYHRQNSPDHGDVSDCTTNGCRLLACFMCKISDAANELSRDADVTPQQSTLEDAIDLLDQISHCYREVVEMSELRDVQLCLKRHAVLVPLRKNDRTTAKAVFSRQWNYWKNTDEMKCRSKLLALIDNDGVPLPKRSNFNEVIVKCQNLLEKIMSSLSKPFLVQAAEQVCEKVEAKKALQQSPVKSVKRTSPQTSPAKRAASHTEVTCAVTVVKLSEKEEQRLAAVKSPAKQSTQSAAATDSSSEKTKTRSGSTSKNNESEVETSNESDIDSFDLDDDDNWRPSSKHAKKAGVKKAWSAVEEELVYKGVQKHGVGNWAQIHANCLRDRSNVDIKDKWRTMMRQGRVTQLERQFGPLT